jgi:hypothetical protein
MSEMNNGFPKPFLRSDLDAIMRRSDDRRAIFEIIGEGTERMVGAAVLVSEAGGVFRMARAAFLKEVAGGWRLSDIMSHIPYVYATLPHVGTMTIAGEEGTFEIFDGTDPDGFGTCYAQATALCERV